MSKTETTPRVGVRCPECGSRDVMCDAWAKWNLKTQDWELAITFPLYKCDECGEESKDFTNFSVELDADGNIKD